MIRITRMFLAGGCAALVAATFAPGVLTQEADSAAQRGPATSSAPHERLAFFEGTWELEPGGIPESIARQAGRRETCGWLPGGRRHMVCRTFRMSPDGGSTESISIFSFREADATYLAYFAFEGGANLLYHGTLDGDRWVMQMQPSPLLPANLRLRTIITPTENGMRFVEEGSEDGGPWTVGEDYRYRRVK